MRISVNTFGTRGDVQPYVALGLGLSRAGHHVRIVTHKIFEDFVRAHGLDVYPLGVNPHQVLLNQAVSELGNNPVRFSRWLQENSKMVLWPVTPSRYLPPTLGRMPPAWLPLRGAATRSSYRPGARLHA